MIEQIMILVTALIFYILGYSVNKHEMIKETVVKLVKEKLRINKKKHGQIIDYISPENESYFGSEQEAIDKQQEKLIREAGIIK